MEDIKVEIPKRVFNKIYLPLIDCATRYMILYGGAGSGKSHFVAQRYILRMMQEGGVNILVVRATGNTNRDSTFALFKQIISSWGVGKLFSVTETDMRITCVNGSSAIFKGLDDTEKLKSITFPAGDLTDVWIEEATETLEADFNQLNLRLRGKTGRKQIVISFNPVDINHWLKKRFFDRFDADITVLKTTYKDNRFLDEAYKALLTSYKESDPYYYSVYCLGEWGVYGKTIFDKLRVTERITQLRDKKPIRTGYYHYTYKEDGLTDIKWIDDAEGYIKIYADPKQRCPYVISGDTAGEGSDFFTAHVLDNMTGEQTAVLKQQFDEDLYADQLYCLGKEYNEALIGIESNYTMSPIKRLQDLNYKNQYVREEAEDSVTHRTIKKYGFNTNKSTRPVIIAGLVKVAREEIELINDIDTLNEMLTFTRNEKGRPEASEGSHDDLIMALAIAHYIRWQQVDYIPGLPKEKIYNFEFEKPKPSATGYGDNVRVI